MRRYMNSRCLILALTCVSAVTAVDINDDDNCVAENNGEGNCSNDAQSRMGQLTRIDPKEVGYIETVDLIEDRVHRRITRAMKPPIFEIEEFLTPEECRHIQKLAKQKGLTTSGLFVSSSESDVPDVGRLSSQVYVSMATDDVMKNIKKRLAKLVQLPTQFLDESESVQVVKYGVGGHYHTHLDSGPLAAKELPCCHLSDHCQPASSDCCQICRYTTVLMYLNDVEEGGETAFPVADLDDDAVEEFEHSPYAAFNLSASCHEASMVVQPQLGSAIMWYNTHMGKNGWLGDLDLYSYHGGCDVLRGEKWIASSWISAAHFDKKEHSSIYSS